KTVQELKNESSKTIKKDPADTIPLIWKKGGLFNINLSQGSLSNWAAGGDEFSLSVNSLLSLFAFYKNNRHSWDNTFDVSFGYVKTTTLGSRKNDDRFDLLSKYGYAISSKWNIAGLFNFRSQLANGYTYPKGAKTFSSAFLSPAYSLLSPGFDFKPNNNFSLFVSPLTLRWVIVRDDTLSAKGAYGVDPGEHSKNELGAFLSANYLKEINKNVTYKGKLDLFSNYKNNPEKIDLYMTNIFSAKISRLIAVSWNVDFIYDDDVRIFGDDGTSPALQLKSLVGIGLQATF
ncbi:MAG TPA: DUF3078 domain-containing protein, partial [Chitinophagaceae bacterium]|nr:DUF3078 domain-containing protein [Chitinophagaceae bacterium]